MYGFEERISSTIELKSINSLSRGVYVKNSVQKGEIIKPENVYFSMPILDGQLSSGDFKKGIICNNEIKPDCAVLNKSIQMPESPDMQTVKTAIHEIRAMLNKAHIKLGPEFEIEISHH